MNSSTAIFLINSSARAMAVTYEAGENAQREIVKTLDQSINEGDFVVVETTTRHNMTVCKVVEADVDFDIEATTKMNWIISKVDASQHAKILEQERHAVTVIKQAELRQKRENLRESLLKNHLDAVKALPLSNIEQSKTEE